MLLFTRANINKHHVKSKISIVFQQLQVMTIERLKSTRKN